MIQRRRRMESEISVANLFHRNYLSDGKYIKNSHLGGIRFFFLSINITQRPFTTDDWIPLIQILSVLAMTD